MEELPEFAPRYVLLSYCHTHDDGRLSFPLVMVYYCPPGVKPAMNMIYAGTQVSAGQLREMGDRRWLGRCDGVAVCVRLCVATHFACCGRCADQLLWRM